MSDSVRPHRWQPTRLPHPWNSPGKNTRMGCHLFFQCMKVKSENEVTQSCPTLCNPMDCNLPASSVHGIFQARVPEWVAIAFSTKQDSIFKSLTLTLPSCPFFIFNDPCDYIELTWIVKNNLAISKSLITSTKST